MKPWVVCLVAACSRERDRPAPSPAPPTVAGDGSARQSIDISTPGAPITIRGVEATPRERGDLEVSYRAESVRDAPPTSLVPALIRCRVADRNVVYPWSAEGKHPGPRLSSLFRPDPFVELPSVCEIAFLYAPDERTRATTVGRACFENGTLHDGACGEDRFAPPALPTAGAVVLERASLELHDASATVTALFTLVQPLAEDRRFAATIACTDPAGEVGGEAALTFVPLADIAPGASMFGPVMFALERTPGPAAQCAFAIVSRTVGDSPGGERIHAQYCLTTGAVRAGRC